MGPTNRESQTTNSTITIQNNIYINNTRKSSLDEIKQLSQRKVKQLRMLTVNFQSIRNKKEELELILINEDIDIVLGSETHLTPCITDSEILNPKYKCYRRDRGDGYGGVIIITKKDLLVEEITNATSCEFISIKIQTESQPLILATAYRPPNSNVDEANHICNELTKISRKYKSSPIWFGGDMNLPDIDWSIDSVTSYQYSKEINEAFIQTFNACNLEQIVDFPTRGSNILEIVSTNRPNLVNKCVPYMGMSDHETTVLVDIECNTKRCKPTKRKIFLWKKVNMAQMKELVSAEVIGFLQENTTFTQINQLWLNLKGIIEAAMSLIPSKFTSTRYSQPWITRECKRIIRMKQRAYNRAKRTKLQNDWDYFKTLVKTARKACISAYNQYISDCVSTDIKNNPKRFFTFIKSKKCENTGIPPLRDKGKTISDDELKANVLNNQFASVFSKKDNIVPVMPSVNIPPMPDIHITEEGVIKLLIELNPYKASGPDGIPARLLKECANEIAPALTLLFNASLKQGTVPLEWKQSMIFPIYKPGKKDRSKAENYRPISLTSVTCKILEHILHHNITNYLDTNNTLTDAQHGFRKKRSCETQLVTTLNEFTKALNDGKQMDTILLDFSKAFDKVDHYKLCLKLHHYGIRGKSLDWIRHFLTGRTQWVTINGKSSSKINVGSGVPQGTVLGPMLFLVYINDLPEGIKSKLRLFADDSYLYRTINSAKDTVELQEDLNSLTKWEKQWSMEFNLDKCKVLRITNKLKPIEADYYMHNQKLQNVDEAKYLGLLIHKKLSWKSHVSKIIKKANQTRAFLQRNLRICPRDVKARCYLTFIRPILEYASSVWDPTGEGNQHLRNEIEMVQRQAARFVYSDWRHTSSPSVMIKSLKWQSLEERRYNSRLVLMHKYLYNTVDINENLGVRARSENINFVPINARIQCYTNSFVPTTIRDWNALPRNIRNVPDLEHFKRKLENCN